MVKHSHSQQQQHTLAVPGPRTVSRPLPSLSSSWSAGGSSGPAPRIETQVIYLPHAALARPKQPPHSQQQGRVQGKLTREDAFDLLSRALWSLARTEMEPGSAAHWEAIAPDGNGEYDPIRLFDALARRDDDAEFPLPGSPRLDGAGGGGARRIAADGSPGIPSAWLRWLARRPGAAPAGGSVPLALAQAWLARAYPPIWAIYRDRVLRGLSPRTVAGRHGVKVEKVYRLTARARVLMLTQIAYFDGQATAEEYTQLVSVLTGGWVPSA